MKKTIFRLFGVAAVAAFVGCSKSPDDLPREVILPETDISAQAEIIPEQDQQVEPGQDPAPNSVLTDEEQAQINEMSTEDKTVLASDGMKRVADLEQNMGKILYASSVIKDFGIDDSDRNQICVLVGVSISVPETLKAEYNDSMKILKGLNKITLDEKSRRVEQFNLSADKWQENIYGIVKECSGFVDREQSEDQHFEPNYI